MHTEELNTAQILFGVASSNMSTKVAVVTGANKGIGLSIVKGLCAKFDGVVYLTARDRSRGLAAVDSLKKLGYEPVFQQLDVSDRKSVEAFRDFIKQKHGGFDLLVNNAALLDYNDVYPSYENCLRVVNVNYRSLLTLEDLLYPLLRNDARVVNISSDCGHLSNVRNKAWLKILSSKDLSVEELNQFVDWYLESVKNGTFNKDDWADEGKHAEYRISKVAMSALTTIQQRKYASRNISINSVHPGFVQTDMTQGMGFFEQDEGASAPLYLALEAPQSVKGAYLWYDKKLVDWYDAEGDYYCKGVW